MIGAVATAAIDRPGAAQPGIVAVRAYWAAAALLAAAIAAAASVAHPDAGAVALARAFGSAILRDRAIPMHLGAQTFTAPSASTGGVGWLGALAIELLARSGRATAAFATIVTALATFALVGARAQRRAGWLFAPAAVALAAACALGSLGVAGGIVTAAFAAALALVLERPGPRAAAAATVLAVVWCNVAPQGLLAPAIALCAALEAAIASAPAERRRWAWFACAGTALGTLATPALLAYHALAFEGLRVDRALEGIVAFHPIDVAPLAYRVGFMCAVLAAIALGLQRPASVPLFLAAALLALANGSYVVVFGVLAPPLLAASAAALLPRVAAFDARSASAAGFCAAFAVVVAAAGAWWASERPAPSAPGYDLAAAVAQGGKPHRLLCADVDWCDAALAASPAIAVFADGRVAAYPPAVLKRQADTVQLKASWRRTLDRDRVDAILARKNRSFAGLVGMSPGWHEVASDDAAELFERAAVTP